ncbi:MAG: sugar nucleotide-binding protein [Verrucomicrobiales bacterium]
MSRPSIAIIGSTGRLGSAVARELTPDFRICELGGRAAANIEVPGAVANALDPHDFDLLINCAGGTEVDRCERYPHWAQQVNAASVAEMAAACAAKGARLIHISSDYVFRGDHDRPYTEDDAPDPISEYGRAKLAGERAALDADAANLVVRVSWLFADGRPCFPDWAIRRAMSQDPLRIVSDKISSPTYARDFAKLIRPLLFGECAVGGVLHLPNAARRRGSNSVNMRWTARRYHPLHTATPRASRFLR